MAVTPGEAFDAPGFDPHLVRDVDGAAAGRQRAPARVRREARAAAGDGGIAELTESTMSKVVAVIGASSNRNKFGNRAVRAFQQQGYTVVPINPHEAEVEGLKAYASVLDVPGAIDMASFYVPPEIGEQVIDEVAQKGIAGGVAESRRRERRADRPRQSAPHPTDRRLQHRRHRRRIPTVTLEQTSHASAQSETPRAGPHRQRRHDARRRDPCRDQRRPRTTEPTPPTAAARRRQRRTAAAPEHHRSEGHEHPEAHPDRQGPDRRRRDRHAQAGADLPDPEGADRAERLHLLGRRARGAARRLRLPARARLQLPARPGRHLRLAVADPQVRSADRRHRVGTDPAAEGRRALLRADQGRGGQLRGARSGAREAVLREPDAALSAGAHHARDARQHLVGRVMDL